MSTPSGAGIPPRLRSPRKTRGTGLTFRIRSRKRTRLPCLSAAVQRGGAAPFSFERELPRRVVEALRALGHDMLTSREAGRANQRIPDEEGLRYATEKGRAVLTLNRRGFVHPPAAQPGHADIVVCTYDADAVAFAACIAAAVAAHPALAGVLVRVTRPG